MKLLPRVSIIIFSVQVVVSEHKDDGHSEKPLSHSQISEGGDKGRNVKDLYEFGKELGRGGFSVVREGVNKENGEKVAIKIIEKNQAKGEELNLLQREIDIMRKLKHKNIISLVDVFDEATHIYLVLELVTGGELFDQIVNRGSYSEADAAAIVRQILDAVAYMHNNGIAHRDLKVRSRQQENSELTYKRRNNTN